jgi:hypothetical protein
MEYSMPHHLYLAVLRQSLREGKQIQLTATSLPLRNPVRFPYKKPPQITGEMLARKIQIAQRSYTKSGVRAREIWHYETII